LSASPDVSQTLVLADRRAPLHALVRPLTRDLEHLPGAGCASRGDREASGVQRDQRELQAKALAPEEILLRDEHILEVDQHVADTAQAHELAAVRDLDARRVHLEDEGRDLFLFFSLHDLRRRLAHHDDEFRLEAVRAPQLLAVEDPAAAVGGRNRARLHLRGIGSDARLGERERGDRAFREARQIFLFLFFGAEELQRLGDADRLVRREPRDGVRAPCGDQAEGAVVVGRAESEPAVLFRDLHPPRADVRETLEELVVVLAFAIDLFAIDVLREEALELREKRVALGLVGRVLLGERMNEIEVQLAKEEIADKRRLFPLGFAGGFGNLHRFDGALGLDFGHDENSLIRYALQILRQYE
jgi:hypothetical protein